MKILVFLSIILTGCASVEFGSIPGADFSDIKPRNGVSEFVYYDKRYDSKNIWEYIASNANLEISPNDEAYSEILSRYVSNQSFFDRLNANAEPYLFYVLSEIKRRGMPVELALLPMIESDYDAFAVSSVGAFGMWQIMPATADILGLPSNWWFEGRKDLIFSTNRALDYLEALYDKLGDWHLVIAAYNGGVGRVYRAKQKNIQNNRSTEYWALELPQETKNYVPKLLALAEIVKNPGRYGVYVAPISNEPYFKALVYEEQLSFKELSEAIDVSVDELNLLNPGYNHYFTHPQANKFVLVPADSYVEAHLFLKENLKKDTIYKRHLIKSFDDLAPYEMDNDFRAINDISYIKINLQQGNAVVSLVSSPKSLGGSEEYQQDLSEFAKISLGSKKVKQHTVKQGDTLWSISQEYGVSVRDIQTLNSLEPGDVLALGNKLVVDVAPSKNVVFNAFQMDYNRTVVRTISYRNSSKDSIFDVSRKLGFKVEDLIKWNPYLVQSLARREESITITLDVNKKNTLI